MSLRTEARPEEWTRAPRTMALMGACTDALAIVLDADLRSLIEDASLLLGAYADQGREASREVVLEVVMVLTYACPSLEVERGVA